MVGDIEGMLELTDRQLRGWIRDGEGRLLSPAEARAMLRELRDKGDRYVPYGNCNGFDPKTGCPGHAQRRRSGRR